MSTGVDPDEAGDGPSYAVVMNDEEQYSVWLSGQELPTGWHLEGFEGPRQTCLNHIAEVWTDMRPKSLRLAQVANPS